jgi:LPXTG-motif cell wall-anchored protein
VIERRAQERDGGIQIAMQAAPPAASAGDQPTPGVVLPATATDAEWNMILGALLMTFALIVLATRRRRMFG